MMNLVKGSVEEKVAGGTGHLANQGRVILRAGEHYAGVVLDAQGQRQHHLVLLAEVPAASMPWREASAWARRVGGSLPMREELALLFANCRKHFERSWYWSSEQDMKSSAWSRYFGDAGVGYHSKSAGLHARAIRRVQLTA